MYKMDFALNNLQWLICRKMKPNQTLIYYNCMQKIPKILKNVYHKRLIYAIPEYLGLKLTQKI